MTGALVHDVADLLGGFVLLLSFALLCRRRIAAAIDAVALQGALVAAAAWQGATGGAPVLFATAAIAFAAKAVAIPLLLRAVLRRLAPGRGMEAAFGVGPSMIAGVALVALATLVVLPATAGALAPMREGLVLALSTVLLGLLMMITRRNAIGQVIGLVSLENGLSLAAIGAGMPLVAELSIAALVLVFAAVAAAGAMLLHGDRGEQG
jgi:hydrogenase-4 component E